MESLALLVSLILLFIFSLPAIGLAISFFEHSFIPSLVYGLAAVSTGLGIWVAASVNSRGSWGLVLVIALLNAIAIWNMRRVHKK